MNSLQRLTSWLLSLKSKLCTILHRKHMSKILSTPTHCCWSVLLLQVQTGQLRHPLDRDGCLGNILPVSHHEEGRQTGEVQGNRVMRRAVTRSGGSSQPQHASSPLCLPFQLREECRQVKHLLSGIPMAILPLLPAKYISPYCTFPAATPR